jgi:hypothetical protein
VFKHTSFAITVGLPIEKKKHRRKKKKVHIQRHLGGKVLLTDQKGQKKRKDLTSNKY